MFLMPSMPSMPSIAIAEDDGEETASQGYNLLDDESVLGTWWKTGGNTFCNVIIIFGRYNK